MGKAVSTRELGLILGTRLLRTDDLHYGMWGGELPVTLANLPRAQAAYTEFLLGRIPEGVETILDVGCGTGHIAEQLLQRGYRVTGLSPSPALSRMVRQRLGPDFALHETTFQAFAGGGPYDLVLFAESFQYIPLEAALERAAALLAPGGHVLICDFFSRDVAEKSPIQGGHRLSRFTGALQQRPFTVVSDEDLTARMAPNFQLVDELIQHYALPVWETLGYWMREGHPWLARAGRMLWGRRLDKLHHKYFSRRRTPEAFARFKSYRCVLLQRTAEAPRA